MINKNLLRMTSLLGVLVMAGCTAPTVPTANNNTPEENKVISVMPENYTGGQLAPEEGMIPGEKEIGALSNASMNVFYNTLKAEDENANVLISPASLSFAFGIAENGAEGNTLKQMEETVNGGIPVEDINPILNYTSYKLNNAEDVKWGVANSLWFNDNGSCKMEDEFLKKAVSYYDAEVYEKVFDEAVIDEINNWIYKKTDHMIDKVIDEYSKDAMLFIVNAMAFEGEWQEQYEKNDVFENMKFNNSDGTQSDVTLLHSTEGRYFELGEGTGFIKPYKGGQYAFVGILPDEGVTPEEYMEGLVNGNEDFSEAVRNAVYGDVEVYLPEFDADYDKLMNDIYKDMGMDLPFDEDKAEFKGFFTDDETSDVWIGKVLHKTHIEVDRKGTKAAAVTVIEVDKCMALPVFDDPVVIRLDRPFVYAIVDTETGTPIFLGCQNSIK